MAYLIRVLYWLKDHWYIPLLAVGVAIGAILAVLFRQDPTGNPIGDRLGGELAAIRAGGEARRLRAQLGAQAAATKVHQQHADAVRALDEQQTKQAEALRDDPVALSKFLVRSSRRS